MEPLTHFDVLFKIFHFSPKPLSTLNKKLHNVLVKKFTGSLTNFMVNAFIVDV